MTKSANRIFLTSIVLHIFVTDSVFTMDRGLEPKDVKYEKNAVNDSQASVIIAQLSKRVSETDDKKSIATQTYPSFGCKRTLGVTQKLNLDSECLCDPCFSVRCKVREYDRKICQTSLVPLCCACCFGALIGSCFGK